ncbi:hypothetical protein GGX14DRAFT_114489 [Mycena pura]|uniref:Uncharacterized protein n=1 Tax=Mycena pura TaxID=153505 RepID=A0AAD6VB06_9AGAR|nr:hypothetical protein GGX14DRAFT_114489 [Mycena pura]
MDSADTFDPTQYNLAWTGTFLAAGVRDIKRTSTEDCPILIIGVAGTRSLRWKHFLPVIRPHLIRSTGIYINLFILAIYTLSRRKTAGKKVLLVACWTMFILGTTQIILLLFGAAINIPILQELVDASNFGPAPVKAKSWKHYWDWLYKAEAGVLIFNNLVTDLLFLYRCYKIWGPRKKVVIFPAILVLSATALTFVQPPLELRAVYRRGLYAMFTVTSLVLMGLTAGRIWWMQREASHVQIDVDDIFRNRPIVLILESGALYCVCVILLMIFSPNQFAYQILLSVTSQINIAPTLIVVRVGLGHNIQDSIPNQHPLQSKPIRSRQ